MKPQLLVLLMLVALPHTKSIQAQVLTPAETAAAKPQSESNTSLMEKMQGTWKIATASFNGQPFPNTENMELTIEKERYSLVKDGSVLDRGTLKVDTSKSPFLLDIEGTEGANAGTKLSCIIKFEKDKMIICYQLDGDGARPDKFESPEGQALLLASYERVTAKKNP